MYSLSICWSFLNAMILYRHYDYMVISKLVPCILLDFTWIEPPILFTILLQMLKPRPVPYLFRLLLWSSFPKSKKSLSRSSSAMPIPVSFIVILYLTYSASLSFRFSLSSLIYFDYYGESVADVSLTFWISMTSIFILMVPRLLENFNAFEIKLFKI